MDCLVCGNESKLKIANLQKLGLSVCVSYDCIEKFIKGKEKELPICKYCEWYCKKENICPPIEFYGGLKDIDLEFSEFGFFCEEFKVKDKSYGELILIGSNKTLRGV